MKVKEPAYGVVVVFRDGDENKFLLLRQKPQFESDINWSFPKGHAEEGETPKESALRELYEEAGIKDIELVENFVVHEEYITPKGNLKVNEYFLGFVKNKDVKIQESEIEEYKWLTFEEALKTFKKEARKTSLIQAQKYLSSI